jgi:hypothetical protein
VTLQDVPPDRRCNATTRAGTPCKSGPAFPGDLGREAACAQAVTNGTGVIATVQMDGHRGVGHAQGIERRLQQASIRAVGRCGHRAERDARRIRGQGALEPLLAAIDGAAPG